MRSTYELEALIDDCYITSLRIVRNKKSPHYFEIEFFNHVNRRYMFLEVGIYDKKRQWYCYHDCKIFAYEALKRMDYIRWWRKQLGLPFICTYL